MTDQGIYELAAQLGELEVQRRQLGRALRGVEAALNEKFGELEMLMKVRSQKGPTALEVVKDGTDP